MYREKRKKNPKYGTLMSGKKVKRIEIMRGEVDGQEGRHASTSCKSELERMTGVAGRGKSKACIPFSPESGRMGVLNLIRVALRAIRAAKSVTTHPSLPSRDLDEDQTPKIPGSSTAVLSPGIEMMGMGWDGMRWDGMGWDGIHRNREPGAFQAGSRRFLVSRDI